MVDDRPIRRIALCIEFIKYIQFINHYAIIPHAYIKKIAENFTINNSYVKEQKMRSIILFV